MAAHDSISLSSCLSSFHEDSLLAGLNVSRPENVLVLSNGMVSLLEKDSPSDHMETMALVSQDKDKDELLQAFMWQSVIKDYELAKCYCVWCYCVVCEPHTARNELQQNHSSQCVGAQSCTLQHQASAAVELLFVLCIEYMYMYYICMYPGLL